MGQMRVLVVRLGGLWCFSLCLSDPGLLPDRSAPVSLLPGARGRGVLCVCVVCVGENTPAAVTRALPDGERCSAQFFGFCRVGGR